MDVAIIWILALTGLLGIILFALKGVLDQLPQFFESLRGAIESWSETRDVWRRARRSQVEETPGDGEVSGCP